MSIRKVYKHKIKTCEMKILGESFPVTDIILTFKVPVIDPFISKDLTVVLNKYIIKN